MSALAITIKNLPPPDDAAAPWMPVARAELGTPELVDGKLNQRVRSYFAATRYPWKAITKRTAWCAAFVSWCLVRAGVKSPRTAGAAVIMQRCYRLKRFRYGCIVVLPRGGEKHHACFGIDLQGDRLLTIDGNSNNRVRYAEHDAGAVLGYYWPVRLTGETD